MWNTAVGIKNCEQLFSLWLAFTTQKKATHTAKMMSVSCIAIFWVVNASSGEKSCLQFSIATGSGAGGEGVVSHSLEAMWNTFSVCGSMGNTAVGIKNCKQLFSLRVAFATQKKATHPAEMMSIECVTIYFLGCKCKQWWKKLVYSFRYWLGPAQVGSEVFHIVLRQYETHSQRVSLAPPREPLKLFLSHSIVFHIALRTLVLIPTQVVYSYYFYVHRFGNRSFKIIILITYRQML